MNNANLTKALMVAGALVLGYGIYNYVNNRKSDASLNDTTPPENPFGQLPPTRGVGIPIDENNGGLNPQQGLSDGSIRRAVGSYNANNFYGK